MDENKSRFVLQIRKPSYWRIELPVATAQEVSLAQTFQDVLDTILHFEKTECPFQRSFTVEIPDEPEIQKRPWAPREADSGIDYSTSVNTQPVRPSMIWDDRKPQDSTRRSSSSNLPEFEHSRVVEEPGDDMMTTAGNSNAKSQQKQVATAVEEIDGLTAGQDASFFLETTKMPPPRNMLSQERHTKTPPLVAANSALLAEEGVLSSKSDTEEVLEGNNSSQDGDSLTNQVHEGAGSQGSLRKARLRRTTGFSMRRSATFPSALMSPPSASAPDEEVVAPPKIIPPTVTITPETEEPPQLIKEPTPRATSSPSPLSTTPPTMSVVPEKLEVVEQAEEPAPRLLSEPAVELKFDQSNHSSHSVALTSDSSRPSFPCNHQPSESDESDVPILTKKRSHESLIGISRQIPGSWYNADDEDSQDSQSSSASPGKQVLRTRGPHDDGAVSSNLKVPGQALRRRKSADNISVKKTRDSAKRSTPTKAMIALNNPATSRYINRLGLVGKFPLAIIAKTAEIVLGPPSHLIALMLRVAARIASGQWKGEELGYDERGEQIPVQWDYSEGDFSEWSDDEDDDVASVRERRASFRTDSGEVTDDGKSS